MPVLRPHGLVVRDVQPAVIAAHHLPRPLHPPLPRRTGSSQQQADDEEDENDGDDEKEIAHEGSRVVGFANSTRTPRFCKGAVAAVELVPAGAPR